MFVVNAMCALVVEGVIIGVVATPYGVIVISFMHEQFCCLSILNTTLAMR